MYPKTILHVTTSYPRNTHDNHGGWIRSLIENNKHNNYIIAPGSPQNHEYRNCLPTRYFLKKYQTLFYSGGLSINLMKNILNILLIPPFILSSIINIRKITKKINPHVIHCHNALSLFLAKISLMPNKKPYVTSIYGKDLILLTYFRKLFSLFKTSYVVISRDMKYRLIESGFDRKKIHIIHIGIDFNKLPRSTIKQENRITCPIRFISKKSPLETILFFKKLYKLDKKLKLIFIGDGPLRKKMINMSQGLPIKIINNFSMKKPLKINYNLMRKSLANILLNKNTKWDYPGTPLVILESQALGVPVITNASRITKEMIHKGSTGIFIDYGEKKVIKFLKKFYKKKRSNKKKCIRFIQEKFNISTQVELTNKIYDET